jgi:hypothetical protein
MKELVEKKINEALEELKKLQGSRETALVKTKLEEGKLWLTQVKE